jgi:hypothetical protein
LATQTQTPTNTGSVPSLVCLHVNTARTCDRPWVADEKVDASEAARQIEQCRRYESLLLHRLSKKRKNALERTAAVVATPASGMDVASAATVPKRPSAKPETLNP